MQIRGMNLCDFCFEPVSSGSTCTKCGLTNEKYKAEAGLLMPGTNLSRKYIIGRVLGRGGFGATYLAYSIERDEVVAIKEYYPAGIANRAKGEEKMSIVSDDKRSVFEQGANRFFEEAKTMSRFNTNKNVVSVYEFFYANDTVYYSMEYLKGIDLKGYIKKKGGRLNEAEAVTIMRGICDALVAVHSTQTLHRDISPDNIFICTNGDVKLIDFGAAKQVIGNSKQVYSIVLKKGFAPPEQYNSTGKQGVWTDIYAVGASIYYAVTGRVLPDAMSRAENPDVEFIPSLNLSPMFKSIITKCLQTGIEDRYQSAIELLGALNELNVPNAAIGGTEYTQPVYNGVRSGLRGNAVSFKVSSGGNVNTGGAKSQTGYDTYENSGNYPDSQISYSYSQSQYRTSEYQMSEYGDKKEKSGMLKGVIIGACALIAIALVSFIILRLAPGARNQPPGPNPMPPVQDRMNPGPPGPQRP